MPKFVYVDESGTGQEPIGVMVGVIADSYRMRVTKEHWNGLLSALSGIIGREIDEIHTRDFYSGNSPWRDLSGHQRAAIIDAIFRWLRDRKHPIVFTAVDKAKFCNGFQEEAFYEDVRTLWRFMALHLSLSIQKRFQGLSRGKKRTLNPSGACVLIFDNEEREQRRITDLLLNAPDWTDSYYDRKPKQEKFSQIVDVPHFVDSKDVGLIQLADFICFFLRKYIELNIGYAEPAYRDEVERVNSWAELLLAQSIPRSNIFLSRGRCACADFFYRYAPETVL
jgi:hypothetical protein